MSAATVEGFTEESATWTTNSENEMATKRHKRRKNNDSFAHLVSSCGYPFVFHLAVLSVIRDCIGEILSQRPLVQPSAFGFLSDFGESAFGFLAPPTLSDLIRPYRFSAPRLQAPGPTQRGANLVAGHDVGIAGRQELTEHATRAAARGRQTWSRLVAVKVKKSGGVALTIVPGRTGGCHNLQAPGSTAQERRRLVGLGRGKPAMSKYINQLPRTAGRRCPNRQSAINNWQLKNPRRSQIPPAAARRTRPSTPPPRSAPRFE